MPILVVLLPLAFFGIGLRLLAVPVTQARLDRFMTRYSLSRTSSGQSRLRTYLASRRRFRVAGVLVAATIGLLASIPQDRVEFQFVPLLVGWFIGAVLAELAQRSDASHVVAPRRVSYWYRPAPAATAVVAGLWTVAATLLRSEGVRYESLLGWGAGTLVVLLVLIATVRHVERSRLRDLDEADPELGSATTVDAVRGLMIGGVVLSLVCLSHLWIEAVPGPYAEESVFPAAAWLAAIAILTLAMIIATPSTTSNGPFVRTFCATALAFALPMAWAVPVRVAQEPPFGPQEAHATARIRLARLDRVPVAQAELDLKPDPPAGLVSDSRSAPTELIGRVDVARPAPEGTYYGLFGFDRRTNAAVHLYGDDGAGWHGRWTMVLPARYAWLSNVVGVRDAMGFTHDPMAVSPEPESGLLWFRSGIDHAGRYSVDDLQLVLMLVRDDDSYIYWATPIHSTTSKVFASADAAP